MADLSNLERRRKLLDTEPALSWDAAVARVIDEPDKPRKGLIRPLRAG